MSSKPMVSPSLPRIKGRDVTLLSMIILADAQPIVLHQLIKASPEQVTVATERQADSPWAKIVSKQDFLKQVESRALFTLAYGSCYIQRREAMLVESQMAKDRELTAWVLVPGDDQASTDFYCSCETYKRPMWYRGNTNEEPGLVTSFSIGSVFTPEHHRKKGYASEMMRLLHDRFLAVDPGTKASFLHSDVGHDFYAKANTSQYLGWKTERCFGLEVSVDKLLSGKSQELPEVAYLTADMDDEASWTSIRDIVKSDVEQTKKDMPPASVFVDFGTQEAQWFALRSTFYQQHLPEFKAQEPIRTWGCYIPSSPKPAYALFTYSFQSKALEMLRLRADNSEELGALLLAAALISKERGLEQVSAWDVSEKALQGTEWSNEPREESIPQITYYDSGMSKQRPTWTACQKYAWC